MAYDLAAELFTELVIGMVIFGLRFYARWKMVGFRGFALDDVFAGVAVVLWILEATFLYTCGAIGSNIGLNEQTALAVPDGDVPRLAEGSKLAYAAWIFFILLIWTLKGVLLLLYNRLTMGLWQHNLARLMLLVSAATFLASLSWHIFSCYPTYKAWQIKPFPGDNCTLRRGNYMIITVLDVVTDLGIIAIPLLLLIRANLTLRQKLPLGLLFSSGIFVIAAAIVRAYYSLINIESLPVALGWASREILVACIVVCAPSIKPLVSDASNQSSSRPNKSIADDADKITTIASGGRRRAPSYEMSAIGRSLYHRESQDHIITISEVDSNNINSSGGRDNGIMVTTEVKVFR
ncbi:hypothetical protein HD806DRAFT_535225 [Xylariaceae sp. AK1471]|nr:hypothetical protein HD806DRAFT_535225 [Xylariaceae sp. AK1471]